MDFQAPVTGAAALLGRAALLGPAALPLAIAITPAPAMLPRAPCEHCTVRHLCLPGTLDSRSRDALDGLLIGRRRLRKGQILFREGERFHYLYAVRFGSFKSTFPLPTEGERVNSFYLAGDVMGFDGAADGRHPTTATALEAAETCAIPFAELMDACAGSPALRKRISQLMGRQLVREYRSVQLFARRHMEERVAAFLLELAGWMHERGYSSRAFQLRMSRADIGSYLGTTIETVSRCLSLFAREGYITVRTRQIDLLDAEGLRTSYLQRRG